MQFIYLMQLIYFYTLSQKADENILSLKLYSSCWKYFLSLFFFFAFFFYQFTIVRYFESFLERIN